MKLTTLFLVGGIVLTTISCSTTKTYNIIAKSDAKTSGTASFTQKGNEVTLDLNVGHLTPGIHAVHLHEKGDCSAPDGSSAGGHWNPENHDHGKWGENQFHKGDIGNLVADKDGNAKLTFKTDKWCIDCVEESKNIIGKGLIIHADKDDFQTQPTGNAGGRVGCVEIK